MTNPFLLFESHFTDGDFVSASSEASGYPAENVGDWRWGSAFRWRASGTTSPQFVDSEFSGSVTVEADTCVIAGHNLKTAGVTSAKIQVSSGGGVFSDVTGASVNPQDWQDEHPITFQFTNPGPYYRWHLLLTGTFTVAPEIAILTLGRRLELSDGLPVDLDPYGENLEGVEFANANNGFFLGSNVNYVLKKMRINIAEPGYSNTDFWKKTTGVNWDDDAVPHIRRRPFWFCWDLETEKYQNYLCMVDQAWAQSFHVITTRRTLSLPVVAIIPPS